MGMGKKAGIITYHFAANYGAVLQCFALKRALCSLGLKASVLNFVSREQAANNALYRPWNSIGNIVKNAFLIPFHRPRRRRMARFREFMDTHLLEDSPSTLRDVSALEQFVRNNHFDFLVSGSDQVWNPAIKDFNDAFFLPFATTAAKIGYAVSTGGVPASALEPYRPSMGDFSAITVREKSTAAVLQSVMGKSYEEVCDPVFLLGQDEWRKKTIVVPKKNYLLCYFVKSRALPQKIALSRHIARSRGLRLVMLSPRITKYNFFCNVLSDCGPCEFLSWFLNAGYVCTDSFHGTAFSLLFNRDFTTCELKENANDGRKTGLLKKVGASARIHYLGEEWSDQPNLDYDSVNKVLHDWKTESLAKLKSLIGANG
jgi:hypothetical protein